MLYCQKTGIESVYLEDSKNSLYFAVKKNSEKSVIKCHLYFQINNTYFS